MDMDEKQMAELIEAIKANSAATLARLEAIEKTVALAQAIARDAHVSRVSRDAPDGRRTVQLEDAPLMDTELPEDWRKYLGNHRWPLGPAKSDRERLVRAVKSAKFFLALVTQDHAVLKAMGEATDPAGGYLVPEEFRAEVILKLQVLPVIRNIARIWPMGRDRVSIPAESARITVAWEGENVVWTASDATMAQITLAVNRLNGFTAVSRELLADSAVSVMDMLSQMYAEAIGLEEDKQFVTGTGVGKPLGLRSTTGIGSVAQAGAGLAYGDFVNIKYTLGRQYRAAAAWVMNDTILKLAMKILDTNGRPIFEDAVRAPLAIPGAPGVTLPQTGTILGLPVFSQDDIPTNLGGGTNESEIWIGNFRYYFVGDRGDMGAEMTTVGAGAFEKHQAALKVWERVDGRVAMTDAFKKLTGVK